MASGVAVNDICLNTYQELKLKKKFQYIIFTLSKDYREIVVDKTSTEPDYDKFVEDLPESECRWAVYDFGFEKEGAGKRNKLVFFAWAPEGAKIKQKMVFASSRDALRRTLVGISFEIQASELSEVTHDVVLDKANKGS